MPSASPDLSQYTHPLKFWLESHGKTTDEAGAEWGVSPGYLQLIVTRWNIPGRDTAVKINKFTGIPLEQLFNVPKREGFREDRGGRGHRRSRRRH